MYKLSFISLFFQLVAGIMPLAVILLKRRRINLELIIFLLTSFLSTLGIISSIYLEKSCSLIFDSWQILTIILLSIFYFRILGYTPYSILVALLGCICLSISLIEFYFLGYSHYGLVLENIIFIIAPLLFYIRTIRFNFFNDENTLVLINTAIFSYKTATVILFYFMVTLMENNVWYVHNFIEGLSKFLIAYALWKLPRATHL